VWKCLDWFEVQEKDEQVLKDEDLDVYVVIDHGYLDIQLLSSVVGKVLLVSQGKKTHQNRKMYWVVE